MIKKHFTDLKGKLHKLYTSDEHPENSQACITSLIDDKDAGGGHLSIFNQTWINASNNLTHEQFLVYLYLSGNADHYPQGYSPARIAKLFNMDIKTARKAKEALITKGYIVNTGNYDNDYYFHRVPVPVCAERAPESVEIDRTTAEMIVITDDKDIKRQMRYAKSDADFDRIDKDINRKVDAEFPQFAEPKLIQSANDIDWFAEFQKVKEENPELAKQLENAFGEEFTKKTYQMRQMILNKYGIA